MKKLLPISVIAIFSVMPVFADNITDASTCTNGVLGTYTGPANIEANFDPNTINTTWYSNGTAMSGNGVPSSCTYAAPLTPPTPDARPGYVFNGWKIRCNIPSTDVSNNSNAHGYKNDSTGELGASSSNTSAYGLTEDNTWGVSWSNGDKVTGVALCSAKSGNNHGREWGGNSSDWTSDETTLTSASGETRYCWCTATHYTANNAQQCSLSAPAWRFYFDFGSAAYCANGCASNCAYLVRSNSGWRVALLGPYVAQ